MQRALRWKWGEPIEPLRELVARGGVVAIPTESSYGLGVDPRNPEGVARVYRIKEREAGKPLPVVAGETAQLAGLGIDPDLPILRRLAGCWPGAVSVVVPVAGALPAAAGGGSLAVRVPGHERLRGLLLALGTPLTATSANRSGEEPVTEAREVAELLAGEDAVVVDCGRLPGGPPSTLIAPSPEGGFRVLRAGRVSAARLRRLLAEAPGAGEASTVRRRKETTS